MKRQCSQRHLNHFEPVKNSGMKEILQYLFTHRTLSRQQAREVLTQISQGKFSEPEITSFTTVYLMRSITIDELLGFKDALLELAVPVELDNTEVIDIVGTGGDGKNTFNISTLSCFIVAGAGQPVAKHGNYGASSISGASNVMEQLGYRFSADTSKLNRELQEAKICFIHAPLVHPALKTVAPMRKNLGVRTFFNMLGPLVNPVKPATQMIGVYNLEMARIYSYLLQQTKSRYMIVHSLDGYDEVSLTGDAKIITRDSEKVCSARELGKRRVFPQDISGGNSTGEAADIFLRILKREGTWAQNAVVISNAALALLATGQWGDYDACYQQAVESLESGKAYAQLKYLMDMQ